MHHKWCAQDPEASERGNHKNQPFPFVESTRNPESHLFSQRLLRHAAAGTLRHSFPQLHQHRELSKQTETFTHLNAKPVALLWLVARNVV